MSQPSQGWHRIDLPGGAAPLGSRGTLAPVFRPSRRRRVLVPATVTFVVAVVAAACGTGGGSDAERFCGEIGDDIAAVVTPSIASDEQLDATLSHYRMLADLAPAAIEPEWRDLVLNLETASTVVPQDPESMQRAVAQAYATERSAVAVSEWLAANCSIDLGPVSTITPQDRVVPRLDPEDLEDLEDPGDLD